MTNLQKNIFGRRRFMGAGASLLGARYLGGCAATEPRFDAQVIVLGAGLSGLHAARLLEAVGFDVLVLEASSRIGGRMKTIQHSDGAYTEGGGEQIGASYARLLDTARTLNVGLTPDSATRRGVSHYYKKRLYGPEDWKAASEHPFTGAFKGASPASPLFGLAVRNNPLTEAAAWRDKAYIEYDINAETFLRQNGIDEASLKVIGHALNGNQLNTYSMMNLYRTLQLYTQSRSMGASMSVDGGAQRLPEAMAASLSKSVALDNRVKEIVVSETDVRVITAQGRSYRAQNCICALPFGALRHVKINAPLSSLQKSAIEQLPYTQIFQLHFKVDTPFWDKDNLPADMWMDGPLERVFMAIGPDGLPTGYGRAWINGAGATALSEMPQDDLANLLKENLSAMRPIAKKDIQLLHVQNWTGQNQLAGGSYMHWAPGQISRWAGVMGASAGRLSFAGEHLSYLHTGMEGAMESGEKAALALMDT